MIRVRIEIRVKIQNNIMISVRIEIRVKIQNRIMIKIRIRIRVSTLIQKMDLALDRHT